MGPKCWLSPTFPGIESVLHPHPQSCQAVVESPGWRAQIRFCLDDDGHTFAAFFLEEKEKLTDQISHTTQDGQSCLPQLLRKGLHSHKLIPPVEQIG